MKNSFCKSEIRNPQNTLVREDWKMRFCEKYAPENAFRNGFQKNIFIFRMVN